MSSADTVHQDDGAKFEMQHLLRATGRKTSITLPFLSGSRPFDFAKIHATLLS